ncbi:ATP synthase subunit G atp20 [Arachnomyces sp. PD_36]|nr:ATP synthase subunit G atp20 [Arachnomyces sp. PD_36]
MPAPAARTVLRQSQFLFRRTAIRHASSTSEAAAQAASKSKDAASSATSKASEGLSKVTSSAGPAITGALQGAGSALKKVGGRTGRVISFVESLIPPTLYYSKVGIELSKLVFRGQQMAPPNSATFQAYYQPLLNALRQPSTLASRASNAVSPPEGLLNRVRNMDRKQLAFVGVTAAEVLGFFTVGEMLGRFKIVGYRGEPAHAH